jgi:hypothetical protein
MHRVLDRTRSKSVSRYRRPRFCLPTISTAWAPRSSHRSRDGFQFRGSIPGLHAPLSTLHLRPYKRRRMTRSRCGSLALHRMKLSFTIPCRFLPAHRNPKQTQNQIPISKIRFRTGLCLILAGTAGKQRSSFTGARRQYPKGHSGYQKIPPARLWLFDSAKKFF